MFYKLRLFFFLFLFLDGLNCWSQRISTIKVFKQIDSLTNEIGDYKEALKIIESTPINSLNRQFQLELLNRKTSLYLLNADIDSAQFILNQVRHLFDSFPNEKDSLSKFCDFLINQSELYRLKSRPDLSDLYLDETIDLSYNNPHLFDHYLAALKKKADLLLLVRNEYDSAQKLYNQIIDVVSDSSNRNLIGSYIGLGNVKQKYGQQLEAMQDFERSRALMLQYYPNNSLEIANANYRLASVYYYLGYYEVAIDACKEVLSRWLYTYGPDHINIAKIYNSMAMLAYQDMNYLSSIDYGNRAIRIIRDKYGDEHFLLPAYYNSLGLSYSNLDNHTKARNFFRRAIAIRSKTVGENNIGLALYYGNLGFDCLMADEYDSAKYFLNRSLKVYELNDEVQNVNMHFPLKNLGYTYRAIRNYDSAKYYFKRALMVKEKINPGKNHYTGMLYMALGQVYKLNGELHEAIEYYDLALEKNSIRYTLNDETLYPDLSDYLSLHDMIQMVGEKAQILYLLYLKEQKKEYLSQSFLGFKLMDELYDHYEKNNFSYLTKVSIFNEYAGFYDNAVEVSNELMRIENASNYLEWAFLFSEKGRARALHSSIRFNSSTNFILPDSILRLANRTQKDYARERVEWTKLLLLKNEKVDSNALRSTETKFETNKYKLDSLMRYIAHRFPRYYELKHNYKPLRLSEIQSKLKENQAYLQYQLTDSGSYVFCVTSREIDLLKLKNVDYENLVDKLKKSIELENSNRSIFKTTSKVLYRALFPESVNDQISDKTDLIVSLSGILNFLPLELLYNQDDEYLVSKYVISYAYNGSLYFEEKDSGNSSSTFSKPVIAFAPSYGGSEQASFRGSLAPLAWNKKEAEDVVNTYGGTTFLDHEASESNFYENSTKAKILHLAMHTIIDNDNPMNSRLVFANDQDLNYDGYITSEEIYNSTVNSDLVVLSACNTGYGKLAKGEGVMNLARAFSYSGCNAILMTHWPVEDRVTSEIMADFYLQLKNGNTPEESLTLAKRNYIRNAEPSKMSPYYWSSFVIIGNSHWEEESFGRDAYILIVVIFSIIVLGLISYLRMKGKLRSLK